MDILRLTRFSELLYMLTWRDIRVRYKQSIMGFLWAILTPSLVIGAGVLVRLGLARYAGREISTEEIMSLMVRAVPWTFFVAALRFGTNSLISNTSLVTKVAFPKEVFPISAILSSLFDFAIAGAALLLIIFAMGWMPSLHVLWAVILLLILTSFTAGLTLLLSAANLFFRDVKYLVEIVLTYAIFLTPVLYDASFVGEWQNVLMLNPVAPVLEGLANSVVFHRNPDPLWTAYSATVSVIALVVGYWSFIKLEVKFAESI
jgi:ABC-type polysaccharide/polyol phosphate export permease